MNLYIDKATLAYSDKIIFSELQIHLPAGRWAALLGPSGVGKSSLLRLIAGLISAEEKSTNKTYVDNQQPAYKHIAYMAQTDLLLPWLTVLANATLGLKLRHHNRHEYQIKLEQAKRLLKKIKLDSAIDLYPHQLSGGMRQRVALARTLIENQPIVLMDEPFSALDAISRYKLQNLAANLLREKTVLFITHDPLEALRLANEIYIMQGNPATLQLVAKLNSRTPRELTDPEVMHLQTVLFHALTHAAGED